MAEQSGDKKKPRICIIGAGPSGMCALYQIKLLGADAPEVKCYEKQETIGGQWNFTWRVGTDEYGERVHSSVYKYMWTLGPKESAEFHDYSFKDHFGKLTPSYIPREIMRQYLEGRFTKGKCGDLTPFVNFRHVVSSVEYRETTDDFEVWVRDLVNNGESREIFTHIIVANGKYSVPHFPDFPGLNSFTGRVLHSHDYKDANEFNGQTILIIGASYSASEIAVHLMKFGAKSVICSVKDATPMMMKWPPGVEIRELLVNVTGNDVTFKDGSTATVDAILFCTGYIYDQGFLKGKLRYDYKTHTDIYPDHLYKGTLWTRGGNNRLFIIGAFVEIFQMHLFTVQAEWALQYILGNIQGEPVSKEEMSKNEDEWQTRNKTLRTCRDTIDFQRDFALLLCKDIKYPLVHFEKAHAIVMKWLKDRVSDMSTYKDQCLTTIYTGEMSPAPRDKWWNNKDDSAEKYLNNSDDAKL